MRAFPNLRTPELQGIDKGKHRFVVSVTLNERLRPVLWVGGHCPLFLRLRVDRGGRGKPCR